MPGYEVPRCDVKDTTIFDKYQCPHCSRLLKNAVQPSCGHWLCESCVAELQASTSPKCPRPDCQENLEADLKEGIEYFADRFVRREIEKLIVSCPHRQAGCHWEGKLGSLEGHLRDCKFTSKECPDCGLIMTLDQMEAHQLACPKALRMCPLAEFGCTASKPMSIAQLKEHISDHGIEHLVVLADVLRLLKGKLDPLFTACLKKVGLEDEAVSQSYGCWGINEEAKSKKKAISGFDIQEKKPFVADHTGIEHQAEKSCEIFQSPMRDSTPHDKKASMCMAQYGFSSDDVQRLEIQALKQDLLKLKVEIAKSKAEVEQQREEKQKLNSKIQTLKSFPPAEYSDIPISPDLTDTQSGNTETVLSVARNTSIESITDNFRKLQKEGKGRLTKELQQTVKVNSDDRQLDVASQPLNETLTEEFQQKGEEIGVPQNTMEKSMLSKHADFEDPDFQLSFIENSNYDGIMNWKISHFSQRMFDAQTGKYTSILSPHFYTGKSGYKMCLRLYILGDGIGKNSHMSLFFVVMKGEFDSILKWPFTHKVTFKLINQTGGRDIINTFQPDPMSSSFRKPKSDMNIASGYPRFVSHTELKSEEFTTNDTIFINCFVDTSISHVH